MAGLGLLFAGLSGAGKGVVDVANASQREQDENRRVASEERLIQERARVDEEKQMRIDEAQRQRARQAGIQQGKDIDTATTALQNQRDAAAINGANGSTMSAADAQVLRDNPQARKAYGLLDATRQSDLEDRGTAAEGLGYLDAAKESRGMIQTEIANTRNEKNDASNNRRLDETEKHNRFIEGIQLRSAARQDRVAEGTLALAKARAGKEDSRAEIADAKEQRLLTSKSLDSVMTDIKSLQTRLKDDQMMSPEAKADIEQEIKDRRNEATRYRKALAGAGLEGSEAPAKAFNPDNYMTGGGKGVASGTATPARSNGTVANPVAAPSGSDQAKPRAETKIASGAPNSPSSTRDMARSGLERAMEQTGRDLAKANQTGNRTEINRLLDLLKQQGNALQSIPQ